MRTAYVTGAERGLGLALVKLLLERDYTVFAGYYLADLPALAALVKEYPDRLVTMSLDVTSEEQVLAAARTIRSRTDSLNLLINNAGSAIDRSGTILDELYFDDMRRLMEINAYGPLRVTQSVIDLLLKPEWKMLVNISSVAGSVGLLTRTGQYGYTMSKSALNMQTKIIYNHFHDQGLQVRAIHPGWMRSLLFGDLDRMKDAPLESIDSAQKIMDLIHTDKDPGTDFFMDYTGKILPW